MTTDSSLDCPDLLRCALAVPLSASTVPLVFQRACRAGHNEVQAEIIFWWRNLVCFCPRGGHCLKAFGTRANRLVVRGGAAAF